MRRQDIIFIEISAAIGDYAESFGYGVVRDLVGHGIGTHLHEDPQIPNFPPERQRNPEADAGYDTGDRAHDQCGNERGGLDG